MYGRIFLEYLASKLEHSYRLIDHLMPRLPYFLQKRQRDLPIDDTLLINVNVKLEEKFSLTKTGLADINIISAQFG